MNLPGAKQEVLVSLEAAQQCNESVHYKEEIIGELANKSVHEE